MQYATPDGVELIEMSGRGGVDEVPREQPAPTTLAEAVRARFAEQAAAPLRPPEPTADPSRASMASRRRSTCGSAPPRRRRGTALRRSRS